MDVSTVYTNFTGLLPDIRIVSVDDWSDKYFKPVKDLIAGIEIMQARRTIDRWTVQLKTNNDHLHHYFLENFAPASDELRPDIFCYALTDIEDLDFLKSFHNAKSSAAVGRFVKRTSEQLSIDEYRNAVTDSELLDFDNLRGEAKIAAALRKPSAMYVPELKVFVMVNTNSYEVLRSQGCLGALKHLILSKVQVNRNGDIAGRYTAWYPLNAAALQWSLDDGTDIGLAFLAADTALKAPLAIAITNSMPDVKFLAADLVYANPRTKRIIPVERKTYVPGAVIAEYPALVPAALGRSAENLHLDADTEQLLEETDPADFASRIEKKSLSKTLLDSLRNAFSKKGVHAIFDPLDIWPKARISTSAILDTVFIVMEDHEDARLLAPLGHEEAVEVLTNPRKRPSSADTPWLDPHVISLSAGASEDAGKKDVIMRQLLTADLNYCLLNARVPALQLSFCVINYLLGAIAAVDLRAYEDADRVLCAKLRLLHKVVTKDRREYPCLLSPDGREVNILSFTTSSGSTYYAAFDAAASERNQVKSYSRGSVADFFAHHLEITARTTLRQTR